MQKIKSLSLFIALTLCNRLQDFVNPICLSSDLVEKCPEPVRMGTAKVTMVFSVWGGGSKLPPYFVLKRVMTKIK